MSKLQLRALEVRRRAVCDEGMFSLEGLAYIVMPSEAVEQASLMVAEEEGEDAPKDILTVDELLASFR